MSDDLERVRDVVGDVADRLVVLDFDGTLARIVDDPDAAALAPGARDAVAALAAMAPVVILSGRHVDDLAPRVEDLPVTLCGGHGTEVRLPDGTRTPLFDGASAAAVLDAVEADVRALLAGADAGWHVERKPASLAVHSRRVASPAALLEDVRGALAAHEDDAPGWVVSDGKAVTELRPAGVDKGTALRWLEDRHPGRAVLVVGDDVTDEDAFAVALEDPDGVAVLVADAPRETHATLRLDSPARVVELLERLTRP